jgi:hypothetical protein
MLKTGSISVVLSVAFLLPARADDKPSEAQVVVNKAITAMGGADRIAKLPATTFKCEGSLTGPARGKGDFTGTWSIMLPDKYRAEMELKVLAPPHTESSTLVVNGDTAWLKDPIRKMVELAPPETVQGVRMELGVLMLVNHLTALESKDIELAQSGEAKIDKRAAIGVKVKRKDLPDVDIFFDKETNLPVKTELRVKDPRTGKEAVHSFLLDNYKEADGVKHFTKLTFLQDEKEVMVLELSEVKRLKTLDAKVFEMPE